MKLFTALLASLLVGLSSALEWWEHGNFYQIYPRSFKDTDGDGVGDLEGVTQNLNYLKDLGMDGIWLSPIFQSPMVDFGYDISDFYAIQKEYGDMDAFERLSGACKKLGIRLILDFVPNHTSNKHKLFELSENGDPDYKDYYVWHPGVDGPNGTKLPPSNWLSYFRGSAWEWSEKRKEFYLHQFTKEQPELNFRNPAVGEEMKKILRFWLNKGVAGFRIDAVPHIFESEEFEGRYRDEPESKITNDSQSPAFLTHTQTMDQPETFDLIYEWRAVLDEFTRQDNETRIIMIEGYTTMPKVVKFFGTSENKGAQIPFNFQLISNLHKSSNAVDFAKYAHVWLDEPKPAGSRSNWLLGNHDNSRMATRFGENKIDLYNIALQTLPDIAVTYYGEEIGMMDQWIPYNLSVDPSGLNAGPEDYALYTRDPVRTPMQWNADMSAGFSKNDTTWLPVADNYKTVNVAAQNRAKKSHLRTFKKLTKYRKRRILTEGDLDMRVINDNLLVYKRKVDRVGYVVVALNFGTDPQTLQLANVYGEIDRKMQVVVSSKMVKTQDNAWVDTDSYQLAGESAIVLQYLWGKNPIVESS